MRIIINSLICLLIYSCTTVTKEEATSRKNTENYNSIDTTNFRDTPGEDAETLRLQQGSRYEYEEAKEGDKTEPDLLFSE